MFYHIDNFKHVGLLIIMLFHLQIYQMFINPYHTRRTYISLPGKGWEGDICSTIVTSWCLDCDII